MGSSDRRASWKLRLLKFRVRAIAPISFIFLGLASGVHADSVSTTASISTISGVTQVCSGSTSGAFSCSAVGSGNAGIGSSETASAGATGSLANGTMGTSAVVDFQSQQNGDDSTGAQANTVLDYIFALPANLNGGTVLFSLTVSGTSSMSCAFAGCYATTASTGLDLPNSSDQFVGLGTGSVNVNLPSGATNLQVSSQIGSGRADLDLSLTSVVGCYAGYSLVCESSTDFYDPLTITGAQVFDASGNLVSNVSLVSQSGYNPNAGSGPVSTRCSTAFSWGSPRL
jgi:hypothetical protein